jgi:hypothetical protein
MKRIIRILLWTLITLLSFFIIASIVKGQQLRTPMELVKSFNSWRSSAIFVLDSHTKKHKNCDIKDVRSTIENMRFFVDPYMPMKVHAAVYPSKEDVFKTVFLNGKMEWNEEYAVVVILHESTHVTWINNRQICGPDRVTQFNKSILMANPPCRLFGEVQYASHQITEAIQEHFKEELALLGEIE